MTVCNKKENKFSVKDDTILSRTCERIGLDDCKTANFIEYCYCTKDLCNENHGGIDDEGFDDGDEQYKCFVIICIN